MNHIAKVAQYKKTNVATANGLKLVVMCYEHAIKSLHEAKLYYQQQQYIEKGKSLQNALDIINELKCGLDFEKGGQIAKNLDAIYNFLIKTLIDSDINGDLKGFDHAIHIMDELKDAWERISDSDPRASYDQAPNGVRRVMSAG